MLDIDCAVRVVFCDFCNTLVDSKRVDVEVINSVLSDFGRESWSITRIMKDPSKSMKENFVTFFPDNPDAAYQQYIERLLSRKDEIHFFPHALDMIEMLLIYGSMVHILSNRDRNFILQVADGLLPSSVGIFTALLHEARRGGNDFLRAC